MRNHPLIFTAALFVAFCLLTGCASLNVPAPQKFGERAAAATATLNTASQTDLTLLKARKITPDESDRYIARVEELQKALDLARSIYSTDPNAAEDNLARTIAAINVLVAELETRK